jgi:HlyD family secretion protein
MAQNIKIQESGSKSIFRSPLFIAIIASLIVGAISIYTIKRFQAAAQKKVEVPVAAPAITTVTALGRLEPRGEVIKLSAPTSSNQGSRVEKLLVKEGDPVIGGQVIAILDNRDRLQAALQEAQEAVKVAQINLAKVQAGAKVGEIDAQKAEIARVQAQSLGDEGAQRELLARLEAQWQGDKAAQESTLARLEAQLVGDKAAQAATIKKLEAELNNARAEFQRYEQLYKQGAIAQSLYDSKRLLVDTITQQVSEARAVLNRINSTGAKQISEAKTNLERITKTGSKQISEARVVLNRINATGNKQVTGATANLDRIAEVRPIDVLAAKAEIGRAIAAQKQARANFDQSYVRAFQNGIVFKVHTRPGETVSTDGIVEIGQIKQMMAVAEVYQSDISRVKPGQNVRVTGDSIPGELRGTVDWVGWQVQRQNIINSDPSSNIDSRVIEVHVRLDEASSEKAARLTNLQVKTVIDL